MKWTKSESTIKPREVDNESSKFTVYLRKNIVKKEREIEPDGELQTYYEYDEAKLTKEEWKEYQKELEFLDIQQQRADIDYIALMMGVKL